MRMEKSKFNGFPKQMLRFFSQLTQNNNREWFFSHRSEYEKYVVAPSCAFIIAMGNKLKKISKKIHAIPRINKSLFRIQRDMRFHKNRFPYRNNLGIFFWEGTEKKRMENSGFYFHIEKKTLLLSAGIYEFSPDVLKKYRSRLAHVPACKELQKVISKVSDIDHIVFRGKRIKKYPPGYTVHNENEDILKYKGLYALYKIKIPEIVHNSRLLDFCFEKYTQMAPLHRWIVKL